MNDLIEKAENFAVRAHRRIEHQRKYTNQQYDVHLRSVAKRVAEVTEDSEMIAAAWLHDVVEDTEATIGDVEREFGHAIATLVDELTDVSRPSDGNRVARKAKDLEHTATASSRAKTIKLADLIDNCEDICKHDAKFARVYLGEMSALLNVLEEGDISLQLQAYKTARNCAERLGVPHQTIDVSQAHEGGRTPATSLQDRRALRLFTEAFTARDIAEPLLSFDDVRPASVVAEILRNCDRDVAGIRKDGLAFGYVRLHALEDRTCGDYCREFPEAQTVPGDAPLSDVIDILTRWDYCFVTSMGDVTAVANRGDMQKPLARMWLFGIITAIEIDIVNRIRATWPDGEWIDLLPESRIQIARKLHEERRRCGQYVDLLECLQLNDKAEVLICDREQLADFGYSSKKAARREIGQFLSLRNNIAHANKFVDYDWPLIARIAREIENYVLRPS